jgi:predicted small lipoprotein YifL
MEDKRTMCSRSEMPMPGEEVEPRTRISRRSLVLALSAAIPLTACGRKGPPDPPEDVDPKAPRRYPTRGY